MAAADDAYRALCRDIHECRDCRAPGSPFAAEVDGPERPPEMAQGTSRPTVLVVSVNPKLLPEARRAPPEVAFEPYFERRSGPVTGGPVTMFERALRWVLPEGYGLAEGNVTNTRVCKCPTARDPRAPDVADHCSSKFLERELALLGPRVVLAVGKSTWAPVYRLLGAGTPPDGYGPHAAAGRLHGAAVPLVAATHLSAHPYARSPRYRRKVRALVEAALAPRA